MSHRCAFLSVRCDSHGFVLVRFTHSNCIVVHRVYTVSTSCLHRVYIVVHRVYIVSTPCLHRVYIVSTSCLYRVYIVSISCLHRVYIVSTSCLHRCTSCLHRAYTTSILIGLYAIIAHLISSCRIAPGKQHGPTGIRNELIRMYNDHIRTNNN